jgi:hypothetical protein
MFVLEMAAEALVGPKCKQCGELTRVFGLESHAVIKKLAVLTFECVGCGTVDTTLVMSPIGKTRWQ